MSLPAALVAAALDQMKFLMTLTATSRTWMEEYEQNSVISLASTMVHGHACDGPKSNEIGSSPTLESQ